MALDKFTVPVSGNDEGPAAMPKLQFRFNVVLDDFGAEGQATINMSQNVMTVTRPGITYDETTLDTYNSRIFLIGKHTWDPITLTVRDDVGGDVVKAVNAQLAKQTDHEKQISSLNSDYKFMCTINMLDGSRADSPLEAFVLEGAMLTNVQFGDLTYAASEQVQITMTIRYDNCLHSLSNSSNTVGDTLTPSSNPSTDPGVATRGQVA